MQEFHPGNINAICDLLARRDKALKGIIQLYGYPPCWTRKPNFETLIHIILEQQVSLSSAKAALLKLKEKCGALSPQKLLHLTDGEFKACYFSRQKMDYARQLARAIQSKKLNLKQLPTIPDIQVSERLTSIKGIGEWTAAIFLLMALQRADIFPIGDLAMVHSFKKIKGLPAHTSKEEILLKAENWRPYRSVATMLLWHHYLRERNIQAS